jgi:hypothetical protein
MSGRPKDPVWEHGVNLAPGWRCNYCGMQKSGGGSTRFKKHLAARGSSALHCGRVPPPVREYFQRDIERTKKATSERARQRVAREDAAAAGNSPAGGYDEEAQIQDAINLSRVEAEFRQGVEGRGGTYERGGVVVRRG